ncbi:MAG: alpha/beta hydrolase [Microbacteriaceae bacterium]|nr:MAG: alpha/beta hydrolase [Microbacteriaceae bacterium]
MNTVERDGENLRRTRRAGVELAFRVCGEGIPVVLLHGTSANFAVWEPVATALAPRATVVTLDQRGHGRSDKPDAGYDGAAFADDVVTVLDALNLQRAVIAGHSLGARNAWVTAARHPQRVAAVVAVDYVPYVEARVLDTLQTRVASGNRVFADVPEIEDYLQRRYPRMPANAVARRARWGYRLRDEGGWVPLATPAALEQVVEGLRTPWDEEFRTVRTPMTCMRGVDSAIVSPAAWARAQQDRPDARWVVIDDADHYVPEEHPDAVVGEILRILDGID